MLQHHVRGGVDDIVDRAHPRRAQAALHPVRARPDLHPGDRDRDETRAEVRRLDGDVDQLRRRWRNALDVEGHEVRLEVAARRGRELSRHAQVAEAVGAVGGDLGFEDGLDRDVLGQRLARLTSVEQHDPGLTFLAEQQLVGRAEHALGGLAGDLAVADHRAARHLRARQGDWYERAGDGVGGARDDLNDLAAADVDLVDPQRLVRAGVVLLLEDAPDDDLGQVYDLHRLDLRPGHRQQLGRFVRRDARGVEVVAKPRVGDLHRRLELPVEAHVVLIEQAQVFDVVLQQRHALNAEAPRIA